METIATPFMWVVFTVFVLAALAVDLLVMRNSGPHRVTSREALLWSLAWIALALAFNAGLWFHLRAAMPADATRIALEFFTGYLVEKALAVDNIFVFLMLFTYFGVPALRYIFSPVSSRNAPNTYRIQWKRAISAAPTKIRIARSTIAPSTPNTSTRCCERAGTPK